MKVHQPRKIHKKLLVAYDRVRTGEAVMQCGFRYPVNRVLPYTAEMPFCKRCEALTEAMESKLRNV